MTLPSGWATATRSYDDQGFPVSTSTSAPEAPPVAGGAQSQQQNSKVGSKTAAENAARPSAGMASCGLWLLLTAPLLAFVAGVVII